jgi:predicted O-methyltransferase YrrM
MGSAESAQLDAAPFGSREYGLGLHRHGRAAHRPGRLCHRPVKPGRHTHRQMGELLPNAAGSTMDGRVEAILAEYNQRAMREWALIKDLSLEEMMQRVDEFLISIGPDTGTLLNILIKGARSQTIVELGTSYGHSTVFFAEAARACHGRVISIDVSSEKQRYARGKLAEAGLDSVVEFVNGDAREVLAALSGPLDFVLIDLWKDLYIPCFDLVYPKLAEGAFVVADNILFPDFWRAEMAAYRRHVREQPGIESVLVPVGSGIELSRFARAV